MARHIREKSKSTIYHVMLREIKKNRLKVEGITKI